MPVSAGAFRREANTPTPAMMRESESLTQSPCHAHRVQTWRLPTFRDSDGPGARAVNKPTKRANKKLAREMYFAKRLRLGLAQVRHQRSAMGPPPEPAPHRGPYSPPTAHEYATAKGFFLTR